MSTALVTGTGLVTALGTSPGATMAGLRAGRRVQPPAHGVDPAGWSGEVLLDPAAIDQALAEAGRRLPGARPASWRGAGIGVRAGLVAGIEAAEQAGLTGHAGQAVDRRLIALLVAGHNLTGDLGVAMARTHQSTPAYLPPSAAVRMWDSDLIGLLSMLLGIRGETGLIGAASASGLVAVIHAQRLLATGDADVCLVVAPALELAPWQRHALIAAGAMRPPSASPPGLGQPLDESADGFVPSQSAAAVVLERPDHAERRGATVIAEHRGGATGLGAASGPEPDQRGQREVVLTALQRAGLSPDHVDYVNAHATGSPRGDACELAMLAEVFAARAPGAGPVVGSTKALLGHGLTAAGLVEYVVTAIQVCEGFVHPMPGLRHPRPHPGLELSPAGGDRRLDVALTTSFGFGAIHAAAVLARVGYRR